MSPAASVMAVSVCLAVKAFAIKDPENQGRWQEPCKSEPDAELPGFLVNMGATGARGVLKERSYVVKYIFKKSPAAGVLEIDDEAAGGFGLLRFLSAAPTPRL